MPSAETTVRLFTRTWSIMAKALADASYAERVTVRQAVKKVALVRSCQLTVSGYSPLVIATGRRPPDLFDVETRSSEQLSADPAEEDRTTLELQRIAMRAHQEARQSLDLREDRARRVTPSHGPYQKEDRVFVWQKDESKKKSAGIWARGIVVSQESAMLLVEVHRAVLRVNQSKDEALDKIGDKIFEDAASLRVPVVRVWLRVNMFCVVNGLPLVLGYYHLFFEFWVLVVSAQSLPEVEKQHDVCFLFEDIIEEFDGALCVLCLRSERNSEALPAHATSSHDAAAVPPMIKNVRMVRLLAGGLMWKWISRTNLHRLRMHRSLGLIFSSHDWSGNMKCGCLGSLSSADVNELEQDIRDISDMRGHQSSWAVKSSENLSGTLCHNERFKLGTYMELSLEELQQSKVRPFDWNPRKIVAFVMANSKGRFQVWLHPAALVFDRFISWGFDSGISRLPEQAKKHRERVSSRVRQRGCIFHATENANYESIRNCGLVLQATKQSWQQHRRAIRFVYTGGLEFPGSRTVIRYGRNIFYAMLEVEAVFNHATRCTPTMVMLLSKPLVGQPADTGNYFVDSKKQPNVCTNGYHSPFSQDPRDKEPKVDDPDYASKISPFSFSAVAEAYGVDLFGYIQKHASDLEMRRTYKIVSAEEYQLFDSTLREPFDAPFILAFLEKALLDTEEKHFSSAFAHKELYSRPYEGLAVEDAAADLPQGEMADSSEKDASVPMDTDAPESSAQEEASGVKVEKTEGSPQGEGSGDQDVHMADAREVKQEDHDMAKGSSPQREAPMSDIASSKDADGAEVLRDQAIWEKCRGSRGFQGELQGSLECGS
ncbi:unnamed protein product [Symbiodinium necroappetens]|uniref:Uncharacterized protein n=1 Tax=Symbiodinium necroappetens TaxID=1628268 RepID=A0A812TD81_9DINO|nr:unnamed protein product [Symbiodinium necroappetens]